MNSSLSVATRISCSSILGVAAHSYSYYGVWNTVFIATQRSSLQVLDSRDTVAILGIARDAPSTGTAFYQSNVVFVLQTENPVILKTLSDGFVLTYAVLGFQLQSPQYMVPTGLINFVNCSTAAPVTAASSAGTVFHSTIAGVGRFNSTPCPYPFNWTGNYESKVKPVLLKVQKSTATRTQRPPTRTVSLPESMSSSLPIAPVSTTLVATSPIATVTTTSTAPATSVAALPSETPAPEPATSTTTRGSSLTTAASTSTSSAHRRRTRTTTPQVLASNPKPLATGAARLSTATAVAVGAAAVTSLFAPSLASQPARFAAGLRLSSCEYAAPAPTYVEQPLRVSFAAGGEATTEEERDYGADAGVAMAAMVGTAAMIVGAAGLGGVWHALDQHSKRSELSRSMMEAVVAVLPAYFAPAALGVAIPAAVHGLRPEASVIVALVTAGVLVLHGWMARNAAALSTTHTLRPTSCNDDAQQPPPVSDTGSSFPAGAKPVQTGNISVYHSLVAEASTPDKTTATVRYFYFVDMGVACVFTILCSLQPGTLPSCIAVAVAATIVAAGFCALVVMVRPFECRFELGFSLLSGLLQVALGVAAVWSNARGTDNSTATDWLGYGGTAIFFVQAPVLAGVSVFRWKSREKKAPPSSVLAPNQADGHAPLLVVTDVEMSADGSRPLLSPVTGGVQNNPLLMSSP